jgi:uncharacterized protein
MFPLSAVLFPGAELPLHIFEPRYRQLTDDCLAADREFGVVLISRGSEVGGGEQRCAVGTVARIVAASPFDDGRWALLGRGTRRITVTRWLADDPYPRALVEEVAEAEVTGPAELVARATTAVRRARTLLSELGSAAPVADLGSTGDGGHGSGAGPGDQDPVWRLCAMAPLGALDGQRLLETADPVDRLTLLVELCDALAGDLYLLLGGDRGPASQ